MEVMMFYKSSSSRIQSKVCVLSRWRDVVVISQCREVRVVGAWIVVVWDSGDVTTARTVRKQVDGFARVFRQSPSLSPFLRNRRERGKLNT